MARPPYLWLALCLFGCAASVNERDRPPAGEAEGCEAELMTDEDNCGRCGRRCFDQACCRGGRCSSIVDLALGRGHACALWSTGVITCWGDNERGQLGDGTTAERTAPVAVRGLTDAVGLSAGGEHSCALRRSGEVLCWGANGSGQLGDGSREDRPAPVISVEGTTPAVAVDLGDRHSCALLARGAALCWGDNGSGQLGDGTTAGRLRPRPVLGVSDGRALSAGGRHSCALRSSGAVACWGDNGAGQLGDGSRASRLTPIEVYGLDEVEAISSGDRHSCALVAGGVVLCWGHVQSRQAGGAGERALTPRRLSGLEAAAAVEAGWRQSCVILRDSGEVACWGRLGDPRAVVELPSRALDLALGGGPGPSSGSVELGGAGCVLLGEGPQEVRCWGLSGTEQPSRPLSPQGLQRKSALVEGLLQAACSVD